MYTSCGHGSHSQIYLTEEERAELSTIAGETGRSQSELIREAVERLIKQYRDLRHGELMRRARGIWKDRRDLPDLRTLRREMDRFTPQDP